MFNPENSTPKKEKIKNVFEMETESAIYSIYYDSHESKVPPELIKNCDALLLECIVDFKNEDPDEIFVDAASRDEFYDVFMAAAEGQKSIYFIDASRGLNDAKEELRSNEDMTETEALAGLCFGTYLAKKVADKLKDNKPLTRREFLKSVGAGFLSAYLMTPSIEKVSFAQSISEENDLPDEATIARKLNKFVVRLNEKIHPEFWTMTIEGRNDLMAQKAESVVEFLQEKLGRKPRVAMIVGAKHVGIEHSLKKDEQERIKAVQDAFGESLPDHAAITSVDFYKNKKGEIGYQIFVVDDPTLMDQKIDK